MATGEVTAPTSSNVQQLPNHKVKIKKAGQRACNEKDAKGKFCGGHLKLWFYMTDAVERECGDVEKAWGTEGGSLSLRKLQSPVPADSRGKQNERCRKRNDLNLWVDASAQREIAAGSRLSLTR